VEWIKPKIHLKFSMATGEAEITKLESKVSFLQVKATMSLQEPIRQLKAKICKNGRQIPHDQLESLAGAQNPCSLMQVFGRHTGVPGCGVCAQAAHGVHECIPVSFNETEVFVDPISLVIKIATSSLIRNDIDPPR
jgi:hypothetical protein